MKKQITLMSIITSILFSALIQAKDVDGEAIYKQYCVTCHAPLIAPALGAPEVHSSKAWEPRIHLAFNIALEENQDLANATTAKKQDAVIAQLVKTAKEGVAPAMPIKGTCMECTDDDLAAAIRFMLPAKTLE